MADIKSIPTSQLQSMLGSPSDNSASSNAQDISSIPTSQLQQMLGQSQVSPTGGTSNPKQVFQNPDNTVDNTEPVKANLMQHVLASLPPTPEGQAVAWRKLGFPDAAVTAEGKITSGGREFSPSPDGVVDFLKNSLLYGADRVGPNLSTAAMIGADATFMPTVMASGGLSLPALSTVSAGASLAGETAREGMSKAMFGTNFDAPEMMGQTIAGAITPPIGVAFTKFIQKPLGKVIGGIVSKLGEQAPDILQNLNHANPEAVKWVMKSMKDGRPLTEIFNEQNLSPDLVNKISKNVFFGGETADTNLTNFVNQYKSLSKTTTSQDALDQMYQMHFPISDNLLQQMKDNPTAKLLASRYFSDNANNTLATDSLKTIQATQDYIGNQLERANKSNITQNGDKNIPVKDVVDNLISQLNDMKIMKGMSFNPDSGYAGTPQQGALKQLLTRLGGIVPEGSGGRAVGRGLTLSPSETDYLLAKAKGLSINAPDITVKELDKTLGELKPVFKRAFPKSPMMEADPASVPLAKTVGELKSRIDKMSPEVQLYNDQYSKLKNAEGLFSSIKSGNVEAQLSAEGVLNKAADPKNGGSVRKVLSDVDNLIPKQLLDNGHSKILPKVLNVAASQDLKDLEGKSINSGLAKFNTNLHTLATTSDTTAGIKTNPMHRFDDSIGNTQSKFVSPMMDHLAALDFNRPTSLFQSKYLGYLLLSTGGAAHLPLAMPGAFITAASQLSARGIRKNLIRGQAVSGVKAGLENTAGRALIRSLLNSKRNSTNS